MSTEKVLERATLVFLILRRQVLLARKTRHIGSGRWNGYGGGLNLKEDLISGIVRECNEESNIRLDPAGLIKMAEVTFHNNKTDGGKFSCLVHVFTAERWEGEPHDSEEMATPTWFAFDELPFDEMMPADRIWLPLILSDQLIVGEAEYTPFQRSLLRPMIITRVASFT